MDTSPDYLEQMWSDLLSRQPEQILTAYNALDADNQAAILAHLNRMAVETGWQPEQRESAEVAVNVIKNRPNRDK